MAMDILYVGTEKRSGGNLMLSGSVFTGVFTTDSGQLFLRFVRRFTCTSIEPAWTRYSKRKNLYTKCLDHAKRWDLTVIVSELEEAPEHGKQAYEHCFRTFCENIGLAPGPPPPLPDFLQRYVILLCDEPALRDGTFFSSGENLVQHITCMECIREAFSHFAPETVSEEHKHVTAKEPIEETVNDVCSIVDSLIHPDDSISNIGCTPPTIPRHVPSSFTTRTPPAMPALGIRLQESEPELKERDSGSEHTVARSDVSLKSEARYHELQSLAQLMRR